MQAEVYTNALSLQRRVMDELLQHLLSAYNTYLSERVGGEAPTQPLAVAPHTQIL